MDKNPKMNEGEASLTWLHSERLQNNHQLALVLNLQF